MEHDQRNHTSFDKMMDILREDVVIVVNLRHSDVFSPAGVDAVRRVSRAFYGLRGFVDVKSLTHSHRPVREGLQFKMVPLIDPNETDAERLDRLREEYLTNPLIRDVMVSADGRNTVLTITFRRDLSTAGSKREFSAEIEETLLPFREEGLEFHVIGLPLVEHEIRDTMIADSLWFAPASCALMLAILFVAVRSPRWIAFTLLNQACVLTLLPGAARLAGHTLTVFTIMLFPLVASVHLTLLAHVATAMRGAERAGGRAVEEMLRLVFRPSLFAALTTTAGLLSLTLSDVRQVRDFGLLGALGVAIAFCVTFGPGLSLLTLIASNRPVGRDREDTPPAGNLAGRYYERLHGARKLVWVLGAFATGMIVVGLGKIRTDVRAVEFLGADSPTRQTVEMFDTVYGGINVVQIDLDTGETNGVNRLPFLRYLADLQARAENQEGVTGAYSYAQLLAMMNQIWEGG
ncbi:MAG: MMPL family transporter, partial [Pseudanabaenales cyanobacterium]|nr:MMPL family transporter [Pseudanabaenales cyanobacterium]